MNRPHPGAPPRPAPRPRALLRRALTPALPVLLLMAGLLGVAPSAHAADPPLEPVDGELTVTGIVRSAEFLTGHDTLTFPTLFEQRAYTWSCSSVSFSQGSNLQPFYIDGLWCGGDRITLTVRVSAPGYSDYVGTFTTVPAERIQYDITTVPVISGTARFGSSLTVSTNAKFAPETGNVGYQWLRDGVPVGEERDTRSPYVLVPEDVGSVISLRVTTRSQRFLTTTVTSNPTATIAAARFDSAAAARISDDGVVGATVRMTQAPSFSPAPSSVSYQWLRNFVPVGPATSTPTDYVLTAADLDAIIQLRATASKPGYQDRVVESGSTPRITLGDFASSGDLAIGGTPRVGSTLSATSTPTFTPTPETLSYQWQRDGVAVGSASAMPAPYPLTAADLGGRLTLQVTASSEGYRARTVTSGPTDVVAAGEFSTTPAPTVGGSPKVGATLTATAGTTSPAAGSVTWQWQRDGAAIAGATSSTYTVTNADAGTALTVSAVYRAEGYADSAPQTSLPGRVPAVNTVAPKVSGVAKVGKRLTATRGTWSGAGYTYTYTWLRAGKPIAKATAATYTPVAADAGKALAVRVTAAKAGFATVTATSATVKVAK